MSNAVFPMPSCSKWPVSRRPRYKTSVKETVSGREFRVSLMASPRTVYKLNLEYLRTHGSHAEWQQVIGFFNSRAGAFDSFLLDDYDDRVQLTQQVFAVGNGSATQFQLARELGGHVEPVYGLNGVPLIYLGGVLQGAGYTVSDWGLVTFASPPGNGVQLSWTGAYYKRVRYLGDEQEFEQLCATIHAVKTIELISVKP